MQNYFAFIQSHFTQRFGEGMEQTFNDLLQERAGEERRIIRFRRLDIHRNIRRHFWRYMRVINMQYKNLVRIAFATVFILLLPLLAMQFTDEVVWDLADFAIAGVLLFGAGLMYELVAMKGAIRVPSRRRRCGGCSTPPCLDEPCRWPYRKRGNPANLMYAGVLAVGFIGAIIAASATRWNGARVICDGTCSGVGHSNCAGFRYKIGCLLAKCVLPLVVCRIGFAVSTCKSPRV